jgi:hypothetical protein
MFHPDCTNLPAFPTNPIPSVAETLESIFNARRIGNPPDEITLQGVSNFPSAHELGAQQTEIGPHAAAIPPWWSLRFL